VEVATIVILDIVVFQIGLCMINADDSNT
jgi:hypothetical protein